MNSVDINFKKAFMYKLCKFEFVLTMIRFQYFGRASFAGLDDKTKISDLDLFPLALGQTLMLQLFVPWVGTRLKRFHFGSIQTVLLRRAAIVHSLSRLNRNQLLRYSKDHYHLNREL